MFTMHTSPLHFFRKCSSSLPLGNTLLHSVQIPYASSAQARKLSSSMIVGVTTSLPANIPQVTGIIPVAPGVGFDDALSTLATEDIEHSKTPFASVFSQE